MKTARFPLLIVGLASALFLLLLGLPSSSAQESQPPGGADRMPVNDEDSSEVYLPLVQRSSTSFWSLFGNAGTDPATHFLGTTDKVTLTLAVNNIIIALRLAPTDGTPNLIGGYSGNHVAVGAVGVTISGGGASSSVNQATADYVAIGGGSGNHATAIYATVAGGKQGGALGAYATVGGGAQNEASGIAASVAGGSANRASGNYATIGGGGPADPADPNPIWPNGNIASGNYATIGGGGGNQATAAYATIAGGGRLMTDPIPLGAELDNAAGNRVTDEYGTVGGGGDNLAGNANDILSDATFATVSGGRNNTASHNNATVGGGDNNMASADSSTISGGSGNITRNDYTTVSGGRGNLATGDSATVAGGRSNQASGDSAAIGGGDSNGGSGDYASIGGGVINYVTDNYGTVSGGWNNRAGDGSGTSADATSATVGGGRDNQAAAYYSTVSGGRTNEATGWYSVISGGNNNSTTRYGATVSGGYDNNATEQYATVCGGLSNTASGYESFACGGTLNSASGEGAVALGGQGNHASGRHSFAAGLQAQAKHSGSFVWADAASGQPVASTGENQFVARSSGGVWLWADDTASTGVILPAGSGSWSHQSDRNAKMNFAAVDKVNVLQALAQMPMETWNYKTQDAAIRHMGPSAQDFYAAFGVGADERYISAVDADGVALVAIQGLYQIVQEKNAQISALEARLAVLEQLVQNLSEK